MAAAASSRRSDEHTVLVSTDSPPSGGSVESTGCLSCTIDKVKIFAGLLISSLLALTVTGLIMSYPGAGTAIYSIFGAVAFGSFVALIIAGVKSHGAKEAQLLWTSAEKVMKICAAVILFSAVAITFTALVDHFPTASTAIFATGGVVSIISFVALVILGIKRCAGDDGLSTGHTPPGSSTSSSASASKKPSPPLAPGGVGSNKPPSPPKGPLPPAATASSSSGPAYGGRDAPGPF
jgi:hypothetical protein